MEGPGPRLAGHTRSAGGRRGRMHHDPAADGGFSLVEAMVASFLFALVFITLAAASIVALRAGSGAREFQSATASGRAELEALRAMSYEDLVLDADPLDPPLHIPGIVEECGEDDGAPYFADPQLPGDGCEPLVVSAGDGSVSVETHLTGPASALTVQRIITWVNDPGTDDPHDYKRVVVVVRWLSGGQERQYRVSTLVFAPTQGV